MHYSGETAPAEHLVSLRVISREWALWLLFAEWVVVAVRPGMWQSGRVLPWSGVSRAGRAGRALTAELHFHLQQHRSSSGSSAARGVGKAQPGRSQWEVIPVFQLGHRKGNSARVLPKSQDLRWSTGNPLLGVTSGSPCWGLDAEQRGGEMAP